MKTKALISSICRKMATYYTGNSEIEDDSEATVQTLTLMNPSGYVGFSDTHQPPSNANFVFFNSNSSGNFLSFPHAPPSHEQQQFVGIPLPATTTSAAPSSQHDLTVLHSFLARPQYSFYNPAVDMTEERENTRASQGLSLSLSSDQPPGIDNFREARDEVRVSGGSPAASGEVNTGENGVQNHVLLSSKYLKVAQEILEEVVHVGKEVVKSKTESAKAKSNNVGGGGGLSSSSTELSTAERQEIQMKKAKLVTMLDEVEQRYREYYRQMNIVISWFETAAGIGSAKTYTALALQTISKQFRCLKDAILGQIQAATKSLGEEEILGGKVDGSRLKFVDNQLRQQRALQQLGMIQQHNNAWRPQRGLPERSVSVLRAWLFEHFLHPYPKDSDKSMLAKQAGLTRNQVSNWFINARVRLWKPMVEEMYLEETKEQEQKGLEAKRASKTEQKENSTSKSIASQPKSPSSESQHETLVSKQDKASENQSCCFNLTGGTSERGSVNPKKPKTSTEILYSPTSVPSINMDVKPSDTKEEQMSMDFGNERQTRDGFTLMGAPTNFMGVFGSYPIEEIQRFNTEQFSTPYSNGAFSLTLGLPHTDNLNLPMSATHHTFLPTQNIQMVRGLDIGEEDDFGGQNTPTSAHSTSVYGNFNIQTRKRFAAQLLPDFVA